MSKQPPDNKGFDPTEEESDFSISGMPASELVTETISFRDLGDELPVGIPFEGGLLKDYKLNPFTGDTEVAIEELFDARRQGIDKVINTLREFIPIAVKSIGGKELRQINSDPRQLVDRMYMGDVFSLVLAVRCAYQETGDIAMSGQCPRCEAINADKGTFSNPYHDLYTVEVRRYRGLRQQPLVNVELPDGFKIFELDDEPVKLVQMEPLRFHQLKNIADPKGKFANLNMLNCAVRAFPTSETYKDAKGNLITPAIYARIVNSKKDKKVLNDVLENLQPGPVMSIDMDCTSCGNKWKENLPWAALPSFLYGSLAPVQS